MLKQVTEYKNLKHFNLQGKVESIDIKTFKADKFKFKDSLVKANIRHSFFHKKLYFDTLGRLEKEINETRQSKFKYGSFDKVIEFSYKNEYTDKIWTTKLIDRIETDTLLQVKTTPDTINGKVISIVNYYHIDKNKNIVKRETLNNGQPSSIYKYKYDSLNRIIESRWISSELGKLNNKWVYEYNSNNKISKLVKTNAKGIINNSQKFEYDKYDNKISSFNKQITYTITYKYDSHNNWTESTTMRNGVKTHVTIREIKYHIPQ